MGDKNCVTENIIAMTISIDVFYVLFDLNRKSFSAYRIARLKLERK